MKIEPLDGYGAGWNGLSAVRFEGNKLATSQVATSPTGWEMNARLGPGINLGNVFDAPTGEGTWRPLPAQEKEFEYFK